MGQGYGLACTRCDFRIFVMEGVGFASSIWDTIIGEPDLDRRSRLVNEAIDTFEIQHWRHDGVRAALLRSDLKSITYYDTLLRCPECGVLRASRFLGASYTDGNAWSMPQTCVNRHRGMEPCEITWGPRASSGLRTVTSPDCPTCKAPTLAEDSEIAGMMWD